MNRRAFISMLGTAAAAPTLLCPRVVRAQQDERMRRIGVLMSITSDNSEGPPRLAALRQRLQQLGWTEGRNLRIDVRWGAVTGEAGRKYAQELLALTPDVILASTSPTAAALQEATSSVPIVFSMVLDPVGGGIVESLARPGGNITGFMQFEYSLSGKWLELLKQVAPDVKRAAVLRDPGNPTGIGQFAVIQAVAPTLGVDVIPVNVRNAAEIERAVAAFARISNGGLIATGGRSSAHQELIIKLAAQHRLPAVYPYRFYVDAGGLISYGPDLIDLHRQAAGYIDRILRGEKPADLPVQAPTRYETVLNLKTAKALRLELPATVLATADEVIE
jgi:putative ABC transport system substrate-binding protein